jgi:oxygen-independent coproporphyrinogen-3 oxidase
VSLRDLEAKFGADAVETARVTIAELVAGGLMVQQADVVRLTARGRLLSNEVFERFIGEAEIAR